MDKKLLKNFNTKEDFQKYIDDNNIQNASDFLKNHKQVYQRMTRLELVMAVVYKNPLKHSLVEYSTLEDFQKFINNHSDIIKSPVDFQNNYKTISDRFYKLKKSGTITGELIYEHRKTIYGDTYTTLEEFQNYIDKNSISTPTEFENKSSALYKRATTLGFASSIVYEHRRSIPIEDYSKINTFEEFQDFINRNNLHSKHEFQLVANTLYRKMLALEGSENLLYVPSDADCFGSLGEQKIARILKDNGVVFLRNYIIGGTRRYFDFYLPDYNTIIEVHGQQHFINKEDYPTNWNSSRDELEIDKEKYKLAIENNIKIIYFTYYKKVYNTFGYFQPVITDEEELLKLLIP